MAIASDRPATFDVHSFESIDDERRHRKERLAATFRIFGKFGFGEGVAGHVTARDPEHEDMFWVNPLGLSFRLIRASDLICVDGNGTVIEGDWPVNQAAFAIHSAIHRARPDVVAAAHTHSRFGRAWSTLGRPLDMITQDACSFHDDHVLMNDYTGPVVDPAEGTRIASALGGSKAAILQNHGLLTTGGSVDEAAWWFVSMERSCEVQLLAESAGDPITMRTEVAAETAASVGSALYAQFSFKTLYDEIVRDQPDLLD